MPACPEESLRVRSAAPDTKGRSPLENMDTIHPWVPPSPACPVRPAGALIVGRRLAIKLSLLVWTLCGAGTTVDASAQSLLRDIEPAVDSSRGSGSGTRDHSAVANGLVWFLGDDYVHGRELWVTDGTAAGTRMAVEFSSGPVGNPMTALAAVGNRALFSANGAIWSFELGASSAIQLTPPGAVVTSDELVAAGSQVYFSLSTATTGEEPWVSDGTLAGTHLVANLAPGNSRPQQFLAIPDGTGVYFFTAQPTVRLWRSDGSSANTREIAAGTAWTVPPLQTLAAGPAGIFVKTNSELWVSDGSGSPATLVGQGFSFVYSATALPSHFVFRIGATHVSGSSEIWSTDGTMAGTSRLVAASAPGLVGQIPDVRIEQRGGLAYFTAYDPQHGEEPWVTDGTAAGTRILADVLPGALSSSPRSFRRVGNQIFFPAYRSDVHEELFVTDGTAAGTRLVADIHPGASVTSNIQDLWAIGSRLFMRAEDGRHGMEPWVSDGTANGTNLLVDILHRGVGSEATGFTRFGQRFVFAAQDGVHGRELWISDGTTAGTTLVADLVAGSGSSNPRDMYEWRGRLWFSAEDPIEGRKLWVSDGSAIGTQPWVLPGRGSLTGEFASFREVGDRLAFWFMDDNVSAELWVTDGSPAGTSQLDFNPGVSGRAGPLARLGDYLYFAGVDLQRGLGLWRTDGTLAGTTLVVDISPALPGGHLENLVAIDGRLWFAGSDVSKPVPSGVEPWISDGTAAGTHQLIDIEPGLAGSDPHSFVWFADRIWFETGSGVHSSDGTATGTRRVALLPTAFGPLVSTPDLLFLGTTSSVLVTDGRQSGLRSIPIPSIHPVAVEGMVALGSSSRVVFSAQSSFQDRELWTSDGTTAGTRRLVDAFPGPLASTPQEITLAGDHLLFTAETPDHGREPFHARLAELSAAFAGTFGSACSGSTGAPRIWIGGTPRLGDIAFRIELTNARPSSAALMLAGPSLGIGGEFGGCAQRLVPPVLFLPSVTDQSGTANLPLAIPYEPSLVGVGLFFEWVIADPQGGFLGTFAMSELLEIVVGT